MPWVEAIPDFFEHFGRDWLVQPTMPISVRLAIDVDLV